ncbi:MAG: hypothetical protein Q8829_02900, partial [Candidatus Phytoplasma australasiaticum]|nr:hypothetical protein [Candidatus Phytoplasma australasiaticum]
MQTPQGYSSSAPYVGAGAPSNYMGVPPYGSSLFNQTGVHSYNAPFSGSSSYHYNYDNRMSGGSPFRQLHLPDKHKITKEILNNWPPKGKC